MTVKPARLVPPPAAQLLGHILTNRELVSAVRTLHPRALGRLIEHVGLEDSGELVALASTEQLRQIFDDDLWRSQRPGQDERFDADRFTLWLEVMLEGGEAFTAAKLAELPEELVTLALHRQVMVINLDELAVQMADPDHDFTMLNKALDSCLYQELGEYQLIARREDGWDTILAVVLALDRDHHDLLQRVLQRCSYISADQIEEHGGLLQVLTSEEMLEGDLAADREDRRARQGFISPSAARSFLALARSSSLPELETGPRDPVTRAYFRELQSPRRKGPAAAAAPPPKPDTPGKAAAAARLLEVLREAEVLEENRPAALLAAAPARSGAGATLFGNALLELQEQEPALHAARMAELAYLANLLMAGCGRQGRKLRALEAASTVVAVCSLGLQHLHGTSRAVAAALGTENADKLFRVGWHLLHQQSLAAAVALEKILRHQAGEVGDRAQAAALQRVAASLRSALEAGKPWLARRHLPALGEVVEPAALAALDALLDECPALGGALGSSGSPAELEPIASTEQLRRIRAFLSGL